ncbi:hypothetical protein SE17_05985 [Kouleothrix aurantiaca]|uniref:Uncharacterized protein n=1 Tax=Kouleothrix aurantiaca TaxID=186479 RepID=A0A0P9DVD8_9CHLR|nr:hypothetical protein SE17_05985 [Kouleothrix aurantiaca]
MEPWLNDLICVDRTTTTIRLVEERILTDWFFDTTENHETYLPKHESCQERSGDLFLMGNAMVSLKGGPTGCASACAATNK